MVDFPFLRNRTFLGRELAVAFIVSFAMLAMFFFMALYMQNILGYSPLEAGVRFLPSTLVIMVVAPIAGRLTDRIGAAAADRRGPLARRRRAVPAGADHATRRLRLAARPVHPDGPRDRRSTMSPMSTAAMNAVARTKAGPRLGLLSMSRMVGGTFGVAALGALFQPISDDRPRAAASAAPAVGCPAVDSIAEQLGSGGLDQTLEPLPPDVAAPGLRRRP